MKRRHMAPGHGEWQPLHDGKPILGHRVQHHERYHLLIIDGVVVRCTATEYRLFVSLFQHIDSVVPFAELIGCPPSFHVNRRTLRTLAQHISRMRDKLLPFELDISCQIGRGYLLSLKTPLSSGNDKRQSGQPENGREGEQ
jgi:DNA-binding response OmpR family regulator